MTVAITLIATPILASLMVRTVLAGELKMHAAVVATLIRHDMGLAADVLAQDRIDVSLAHFVHDE